MTWTQCRPVEQRKVLEGEAVTAAIVELEKRLRLAGMQLIVGLLVEAICLLWVIHSSRRSWRPSMRHWNWGVSLFARFRRPGRVQTMNARPPAFERDQGKHAQLQDSPAGGDNLVCGLLNQTTRRSFLPEIRFNPAPWCF